MYPKPYTSLIIFCLFALSPMSSFSAPVAIDSSVLEDRSDSDTHFGIGSTSSIAQRPFIGVDDQELLYLIFLLVIRIFTLKA